MFRSKRNLNLPASGGAKRCSRETLHGGFGSEIGRIINSCDDIADAGIRFAGLIDKERKTNKKYNVTSVVPFEYRERLKQITSNTRSILPEYDYDLSHYFNMNEKACTGIFIFVPHVFGTRTIQVESPAGMGMKRVKLYDIDDIIGSEVRLNNDVDHVSLPACLFDSVGPSEMRMILSMYRLTARTICAYSKHNFLSSRTFGQSVSLGYVNSALNTRLPLDVIQTLRVGMNNLPNLSQMQNATFGQMIIYAIINRVCTRVEEIPRMNLALYILSIGSRLIKSGIGAGMLATPLAMIIRWFRGVGCFDCTLRTCNEYIELHSIIAYPTGYPSSSLNFSGGLPLTPVVLPNCDHGSMDGAPMRDPLSSSLPHEFAEVAYATNLHVSTMFSARTALCSEGSDNTIWITTNSNTHSSARFLLAAEEAITFLRAMDYMLQTIKSYTHTRTYVGAYVWCTNNDVGPSEISSDVTKLLHDLYAKSQSGDVVGRGYLLLAVNINVRRLVGIDISKFLVNDSGNWASEIVKQIFTPNIDEGTLATCYGVRELFYSCEWQKILPTYDMFQCRIEYMDSGSDSGTDTDSDVPESTFSSVVTQGDLVQQIENDTECAAVTMDYSSEVFNYQENFGVSYVDGPPLAEEFAHMGLNELGGVSHSMNPPNVNMFHSTPSHMINPYGSFSSHDSFYSGYGNDAYQYIPILPHGPYTPERVYYDQRLQTRLIVRETRNGSITYFE